MWRSGKKLLTFEFSRPFVLNDLVLRKIIPTVLKVFYQV